MSDFGDDCGDGKVPSSEQFDVVRFKGSLDQFYVSGVEDAVVQAGYTWDQFEQVLEVSYRRSGPDLYFYWDVSDRDVFDRVRSCADGLVSEAVSCHVLSCVA